MEKKTLTPEQFNALPVDEKKVLIAHDVIEQIRLERYIATKGTYVDERDFDEFPIEDSAREILMTKSVHCTVCMRGALFLSSVRYKNKLNITEVQNASFQYDDTSTDNKVCATDFMEDVFTRQEQGIMESIFEGSADYLARVMLGKQYDWAYYDDDTTEDKDGNPYPEEFIALRAKVIIYMEKLGNDFFEQNRIREKSNYIITRLCQNIIENNGTLIF